MSTAAVSRPPDDPLASSATPVASPYTAAFWAALGTLADRGVPAALVPRALETWWRLAHARPPEPELEMIREEALRFAWSYEDCYLHLDVREDGYEWFYRVETPRASTGTQDPEPVLSPAFFACLTTLRARHAT